MFKHVLDKSNNIDAVHKVSAGKYRRYPNQSFFETIRDVETHIKNAHDGVKTIQGLAEALRLLSKHKPDVLFLKGGYVSVPMGIAARIRNVPYIVHDSDATVSLTGKIVGRWAKYHVFGIAIPKIYANHENALHLGVPVSRDFKKVSNAMKKDYQKQLSIPEDKKVVLVVGGSQGAETINRLIKQTFNQLNHNVMVLHQTGKGNQTSISDSRYRQVEYIEDMSIYSGAADVIVSRAGSTIAEFSKQEKPVIVIPGKKLAGSHQLANATILQDQQAAIMLDEDDLLVDSKKLPKTVNSLLSSEIKSTKLAENLQKVFPGNASKKIAELLIKEVSYNEKPL